MIYLNNFYNDDINLHVCIYHFNFKNPLPLNSLKLVHRIKKWTSCDISNLPHPPHINN